MLIQVATFFCHYFYIVRNNQAFNKVQRLTANVCTAFKQQTLLYKFCISFWFLPDDDLFKECPQKPTIQEQFGGNLYVFQCDDAKGKVITMQLGDNQINILHPGNSLDLSLIYNL